MLFAHTVNFVFEKAYLRVLSIPEIIENIVTGSSVNGMAWIEQNFFSSDLQQFTLAVWNQLVIKISRHTEITPRDP